MSDQKPLDPRVTAMIDNMLLSRSALLRHLIDPKRDIEKECGYPANPEVRDFKKLYDRNGVGTRVVEMWPEESWQVDPELLEEEAGDLTPWEKQWMELEARHCLYAEMLRADILSGIGTYGILLLGIDDGLEMHQEVAGVEEAERALLTGEGKPTTKRKGKLLYVRAFDESVLSVSQWQTDPKNWRYGQPVTYDVNMANIAEAQHQGASPDNRVLKVHWTRCIHLADNRRNSNVHGVPRMKKGFNRIWDLEKLMGGSAEMFWKGGFPGLALEMTPNAVGVSLTAADKTELREQIEQYQQGLQRYLALEGLSAKSLTPQVSDPRFHFELQIKALCIGEGIPYRVFMGSEEAQLAGEQDKREWKKRLIRRENKYISPYIVQPTVNRLMAMGVLDFNEKVRCVWPDLNASSEKEKADIADKRTTALQKYLTSGMDQLIIPVDYLTHIMGMTAEIAESMLEKAELDAEGFIEYTDEEKLRLESQAEGLRRQRQESKFGPASRRSSQGARKP